MVQNSNKVSMKLIIDVVELNQYKNKYKNMRPCLFSSHSIFMNLLISPKTLLLH